MFRHQAALASSMWSRRQDSQEFLHTDGIPEEDWPPGEINWLGHNMEVGSQTERASVIVVVNLQTNIGQSDGYLNVHYLQVICLHADFNTLKLKQLNNYFFL